MAKIKIEVEFDVPSTYIKSLSLWSARDILDEAYNSRSNISILSTKYLDDISKFNTKRYIVFNKRGEPVCEFKDSEKALKHVQDIGGGWVEDTH